MGFHKVGLLFRTLRQLKFQQIYFQVYYRVRTKFFGNEYRIYPVPKKGSILWNNNISSVDSYVSKNKFVFLNKEKQFEDKIDWNIHEFGKLWTYNLNYFDFLNQSKIIKEEGVRLIRDFIEFNPKYIDGIEPYPISLRTINWIKFIGQFQVKDELIDSHLYSGLKHLLGSLEYHLLGNHLLENGFSLLFGACYFEDDKLYKKGKEIVKIELNEQVLSDGGHFELSPMYHQIILFRLLEIINLIQNNPWQEDDLLEYLITKAKLMLGWIEEITFVSGDIPLFNDSAIGISPRTDELVEYAKLLNLSWEKAILVDSGYRKMNKQDYELVVDVGQIGPDYIPGHAHADTFNFELYVKGEPFIVDTGITTYEKNEIRQNERATESHNTVKIGDKDQSEVWGGFRVGRRAKVKILEDGTAYVNAVHNGYEHIGISHQRSFSANNNKIVIVDNIKGNTSGIEQKAFLHFHPSVDVRVEGNKIATSFGTITFNNEAQVQLNCYSYNYSLGFNRTAEATKVCVKFSNDELKTSINLMN